jgi:hypothetical protein
LASSLLRRLIRRASELLKGGASSQVLEYEERFESARVQKLEAGVYAPAIAFTLLAKGGK